WRPSGADGQHRFPGAGTAALSREEATTPVTHSLPSRYAVWPSPSYVRRCPLDSSLDKDTAHSYGVAGSRVVPTTRIGPLPGALIGFGPLVGGGGPEGAG